MKNMQWDSFIGRFQFVCFVLIAYYPHISFQDCPKGNWHGCPANDECYCINNPLDIYCDWGDFPVFPLFSYYNSENISLVSVYGTFTNIYDNAYYLLKTLNEATVCLQQQQGRPSTLMTYEDTFATTNPKGITSLQFFYFNPINLTTVSNNQDITSLLIQKSNLGIFPVDAINHFPNLNTLDLTNNMISTVQLNSASNSLLQSITLNHNQITQIMISGPSFSNVDVSYNQLTTLATPSFQSSSSSPINITANNNLLISISINAFNFTSKSISIDVSNNKITSVDQGFSKWIQASTNFTLNLSNNPLPCDSSIQWMGTFIICSPAKIIIAMTETCPNGEPVYDYLAPYAKCG
jgi:hypothetical protein